MINRSDASSNNMLFSQTMTQNLFNKADAKGFTPKFKEKLINYANMVPNRSQSAGKMLRETNKTIPNVFLQDKETLYIS